jgi:hypothetical protein
LQKNTSIAIIGAIIVALAFLAYFTYQPIMNNIKIGTGPAGRTARGTAGTGERRQKSKRGYHSKIDWCVGRTRQFVGGQRA